MNPGMFGFPAGGGNNTPGGWHLLGQVNVASPQPDVTFDVPINTFTALRISYTARSTDSGGATNLRIRFNRDASAEYDSTRILVASTTLSGFSANRETSSFCGALAATGAGDFTPGVGTIDIPLSPDGLFSVGGIGHCMYPNNPTVTIPIVYETHVFRYTRRMSVSTVTLFPAVGQFATGSRLTCHGII